MHLELKDQVRLFAGVIVSFVIAFLASSFAYLFLNGDMNGDPFEVFSVLTSFSIHDDTHKTVVLVFIGAIVLCAALVVFLAYQNVSTKYGTSHFMSIREMRKAGFVTTLTEGGLIFGKVAVPPKEQRGKPLEVTATNEKKALQAEFISAPIDRFPQCLLVGPTRSGKGVGYFVPNCLLADGSLVILDVKGELWKHTARARAALGDEVFRFAPYDFENPSHHYNPLARIAEIQNQLRQYAELDKLADVFLVAQSGSSGSFLGGARQWFIAACMHAIECRDPTLTKVHALMFGDGSQVGVSDDVRYNKIAQRSKIDIVRREFSNFGNLDSKIRQSYSQVMSDSGLKQWANPQIQAVTRRNDICFDDIRAKRKSIYIVVNSDDISPLNAVVRLLFSDLIASLRRTSADHNSGLEQVFIMLDEFDQLGYMPIVPQSMKQLAGHGGRTTIATQSIPGLKSVGYSDAEIESLIAGCEMKLYISPNDHSTADEISKSLGTRTGYKASYSYTMNDFSNRSVSLSTEELPLLSFDQIRRLPKSKILLMPEGHLPIMADRIVYYQDSVLKHVYESQSGSYPYPSQETARLDDFEERFRQQEEINKQLRQELEASRSFREEKTSDQIVKASQVPTEDQAKAAFGRQSDIEARVDEAIKKNQSRKRGEIT